MLKTCLLLAGFSLIQLFSFSQVVGFEENKGQIADSKGNVRNDVLFRASVGNVKVYFFDDHISYYFKKKSDLGALGRIDVEELTRDQMKQRFKLDKTWYYRVDMQFVGGKAEHVHGGRQKERHYANYFLAHCPQGIHNVEFYRTLYYEDVYPGVDVQFAIKNGRLKYDIVVNDDGNLQDVKLKYVGPSDIDLQDNQLHLTTGIGDMQEELPYSYTTNPYRDGLGLNPEYTYDAMDWEPNPDMQGKTVDVKYVLDDNRVISFSADLPDQKNLIVDPELVWSTYYNYDDDAVWGQELDADAGYVVSLSITSDNTMPTLDPGGGAWYVDTVNDQAGADQDLRILQFDTDGQLLWATFYGGSLQEVVKGGVDINPTNGDIFISAQSASLDFPTQDLGGGAWYEPTNTTSEQQVVLLRFNSSGQRLWGTYFNGNVVGNIYDVEVTAAGEFYIAGDNGTGNVMPTQTWVGAYNQATPSANQAFDNDGYIASFTAAGVIQWGTYFGTDDPGVDINESFKKIEIDGNGNIYVVGTIDQPNGFVANAGGYFDNSHNGSADAFIVRFDNTGTMDWATYFGGTASETDVYGADIDPNNNFYISGITTSSDIPTQDPGGGAYFNNTIGGTQSGWFAKFDASTNLEWSTYFGATDDDWRTTLDATPNGKLVVVEYTDGTSGLPDMSQTGGYYLNVGTGSRNGFLAKFDTSGVQEHGTYVSSSGNTEFYCVTSYDGLCGDQIYVSGLADDPGYPVLDSQGSAYQANHSGSGIDKFIISRFDDFQLDPGWVPPTSVCENSPAINLTTTITGDTGGEWTASCGACIGTTTGIFDPAGQTGIITVTYTVGTPPCTWSHTEGIVIDTVSIAPTGVTATLDSVCVGQSTTLSVVGGTLGSNATWEWYKDACGSNYQGTGASLIVNPLVTSTYYVRAEGTCGNTTCDSITIVVNTLSSDPASATANDLSVCIGDSTYLQVVGGSLGTGATWNWYTGSCGGTLVGTTTDSLVIYPTGPTNYYVEGVGTCNTTVCHSVSISTDNPSTDPTGISATDTVICTGSSTTMSVVGGSLGTGATWQWYESSCGGTSIGTGVNLLVSPTVTTTYFVRPEGTCGNGNCVQLTIDVQTPSTDPTNIQATNTNMCDGDTISLTAQGGTLGQGADYYWYIGGCGAGVAIDTGTTIQVSPSTTTTYFVRAEGFCNTTNCTNTTITVNPAGDAGWVSPDSVCESSGLVNLDALITGNTGGSWSGIGVAGSFFSPTGLAGQTVSVTYTEGTNPCVDQNTQTIFVSPQVFAQWTNPSPVCENNGLVVLDSFVIGATGGTWSGNNVTGNEFDPSGQTGTVNITYIVTGGACVDSTTLPVSVISGPTAPIVTVTDTSMCEGDTSVISANTASCPLCTYEIYDASTGGNLLGQTDYDASPSTTTTYYVVAVDDNGCFHQGASIPVTITVTPAPNGDAGQDTSVCFGNSVTLTATGGTDYVWSTTETTPSITVTPIVDTYYSVVITDGGTSCSMTDSVLVQVIGAGSVVAVDDSYNVDVGVQGTFGVMINDTGGDPTTLVIVSPPSNGTASVVSGSIIYTSNEDFSGQDQLAYLICHPLCPTICDTGYVTINVEVDDEDITAPTAFSPNGDGINDNFVIVGLNLFPQAELQVFNRWGELVYFAQPYNNDWGGESNGARTLGDQVLDGTYFYILKLGDAFRTLNGYVEVKR